MAAYGYDRMRSVEAVWHELKVLEIHFGKRGGTCCAGDGIGPTREIDFVAEIQHVQLLEDLVRPALLPLLTPKFDRGKVPAQ